MYQIAYTKTALKDIPKLKAAHLDKKAKALIEVIRQNPYQTPPTYEKLVGNMYGLYSRRVNYQHRLVYKVHEEEKIIQIICMAGEQNGITPYQQSILAEMAKEAFSHSSE